MVRLLFFIVLTCWFTCVQAQQITVRPERNGNVYLVGSGLPETGDSCSKQRVDSGKLSVVCYTPAYRGLVRFFFTDGDEYEYIAKEPTPDGSFVVLLRGRAKLPQYKKPTWGILAYRDRVYGDTVLLQKLQATLLTKVEYSREDTDCGTGKKEPRYKKAVVIKISAHEAAEMRKKLKAL